MKKKSLKSIALSLTKNTQHEFVMASDMLKSTQNDLLEFIESKNKENQSYALQSCRDVVDCVVDKVKTKNLKRAIHILSQKVKQS